MKHHHWLWLSCLPWAVLAHPVTPMPPAAEGTPDLPATTVVQRVLTSLPQVQAAQRMQAAEEARRDGLLAGPHEWNLSAGVQRLRSTPVGLDTERFTEWNAGIERGIRLPGKARLDANLGEAAIVQARLAYGDALHESARELLKRWFNWQRETAITAQWAHQIELLKQQATTVNRRQTLGDAARLETLQASAALAQAEAQQTQASLRARNAAEELRRNYPGLPLLPPPETEPTPVAGEASDWLTAITEHSHEHLLARATTRHAQLQAERQQQDRTPDPTLGLQVSRGRGGEEQVIGLTVSIPISGDARRAASQSAHAEAEASAHNEASITRKVTTEAMLQYQTAQAGYTAWIAAKAAAQRIDEATSLLERAYRLGEGSLSDLLYARRQAHEARLASTLSRLDAQEQHYRLLLDAHRLWDFEDEDADQKTASDTNSSTQ